MNLDQFHQIDLPKIVPVFYKFSQFFYFPKKFFQMLSPNWRRYFLIIDLRKAVTVFHYFDEIQHIAKINVKN